MDATIGGEQISDVSTEKAVKADSEPPLMELCDTEGLDTHSAKMKVKLQDSGSGLGKVDVRLSSRIQPADYATVPSANFATSFSPDWAGSYSEYTLWTYYSPHVMKGSNDPEYWWASCYHLFGIGEEKLVMDVAVDDAVGNHTTYSFYSAPTLINEDMVSRKDTLLYNQYINTSDTDYRKNWWYQTTEAPAVWTMFTQWNAAGSKWRCCRYGITNSLNANANYVTSEGEPTNRPTTGRYSYAQKVTYRGVEFFVRYAGWTDWTSDIMFPSFNRMFETPYYEDTSKTTIQKAVYSILDRYFGM